MIVASPVGRGAYNDERMMESMGVSEETDADQSNDTNAMDRHARIEGRTTRRAVAEITTRV